MSAVPYTALEDGSLLHRPSLLKPAKAVLSLAGVLLTGLGGLALHGSLFTTTPTTTQQFTPKQGMNEVLVKPGPLMPFQLVSPAGLFAQYNKFCLFLYGPRAYSNQLSADSFVRGSEEQEGWVYGARLTQGILAEVTGNPEDILKGQVLCWTKLDRKAAEGRLKTADREYNYMQGNEDWATKRHEVKAVLRDGSSQKVALYFAAQPSTFVHLPDAIPTAGPRPYNLKRMPKVVIFGGTGKLGTSSFRGFRRIGYTDTKVVGRTPPKEGSELYEHFIPLDLASWMSTSFILTWVRGSELYEHFIPLGCETVQDFKPGDRAVKALQDADIIINTMGPFQGRKEAETLQAILANKDPTHSAHHPQFYMDVADDIEYATMCKQLEPKCQKMNVTGISSGGISPGLSNLLVVDAFTFLLLGQDCQVMEDGVIKAVPSCSEVKLVNFTEVGPVRVTLLNLPEAQSLAKNLDVSECKAYFGTGPEMWNSVHLALAKNLPRKWLKSREWCENFAKISMFPNRIVDKFVGAAVGMKLEVGDQIIDFFHPDCLESAGFSVALLAQGMWEQGPRPGVYFPEEFYDPKTRAAIFARARELGCTIEQRDRVEGDQGKLLEKRSEVPGR
eukprot:g76600.t1